MRRLLFIASLALLTLPSVGCCYRAATCDPYTGLSRGGCWEPSPLLNCVFGCSGGLFDTCCTGGYNNACCGPAVSMAPTTASCCDSAGPTYHSAPTYGPSPTFAPTSGPHLSVPQPMAVPASPEPVSYYSPHVQSGLKVTSHPETSAPVHQQAKNSNWIKAGY